MNEKGFGLSPREIALLRCIRDGELPRKEVARMLSMPQPELTRLVESLETKGFVGVRKHGVSTSLTFSDTKHASMLRRILNEFAHMRLERILSLASLRVVSSLASQPVSTRKEILESSGASPRTIQTVLSRLREVGVLHTRKRGEYRLGDRFVSFADFARELISSQNQRHAVSFSSDSVVVWERNNEFIVRTRTTKETKDFRKTAFSAFEGYGVPLVQDWQYYYHSHGRWRRTPDEVLLHSLLLKPLSSREMNAIKTLWNRKMLIRRVDRLREKAKRYGVQAELVRLISTPDGQETKPASTVTEPDRPVEN